MPSGSTTRWATWCIKHFCCPISRLLWSVNISMGCNPIREAYFFKIESIAYPSFSLTGHVYICPVVNFREKKAIGYVFIFSSDPGGGSSWLSSNCSSTPPTAFSLASVRMMKVRDGLGILRRIPSRRELFKFLKQISS